MELLRDSIPMVSLAVSAAALYARAASSCVRPGFPRLAALLPIVAFLAAAPFAFSSTIARGLAGFFLAWLGVFKVLLLAAGRGPLDPTLPVLPFVFTAALPVKLRRGGPGAAGASAASKAKSMSLIVSCAVKVAVIAALLHAYQFIDQLHLYMRLALYGVHIYFFLELLLPCLAAAGGALGMEMGPQFDRPYLASSLRDFWGRRWNLMVSAILRPSVYDPVRARDGKAAATLATFLVSGLMHEAMVYYLTLRLPTGEMTAFFLLHGVCCVGEALCARRWAARGWPPPPRPVATLLVVAFLTGTAFWLFFPPICREGSEEALLEEWAAVAAFFEDAGRKLLRYV
ncbi:putative long-chain-alcohol O-fatty-acyltransferase 4 [Dichanthelium oligosanthes]|uniref:Putative long-chain-alcohol O-fatty-acyltransferase 4 n=1 Tax=Dichanthelium oligosanthes TaxID=888268 RepID=A0A1E5W7Z2_9POAL|nr:putative long-chain-alcohol O-fatty-acyltransferase 4 [Dichanthelium oligosanthes]